MCATAIMSTNILAFDLLSNYRQVKIYNLISYVHCTTFFKHTL